jgi:hypothetical protein
MFASHGWRWACRESEGSHTDSAGSRQRRAGTGCYRRVCPTGQGWVWSGESRLMSALRSMFASHGWCWACRESEGSRADSVGLRQPRDGTGCYRRAPPTGQGRAGVEGLKSFNLVFAPHECACVDVLPELAVAASLVRREPFVVSSWSGGSDGLSVTVNFALAVKAEMLSEFWGSTRGERRGQEGGW